MIVEPAALTTEHINGRRAAQLPPLRLFVTVLLALIVVGWMTGGAQFGAGVREGWQVASNASRSGAASVAVSRDRADRQEQADAAAAGHADHAKDSGRRWLRGQARRAAANPGKFWQAVEDWSQRAAFMMLPIAVCLLFLLFLSRPGLYLFDHAIFAMHSLSFQGLLLITAFLISSLGGWADWFVLALLVTAAPSHLFVHMRGVYSTGPLGTIGRMFLLGAGSLLGFGAIVLALVLIGLNSV